MQMLLKIIPLNVFEEIR